VKTVRFLVGIILIGSVILCCGLTYASDFLILPLSGDNEKWIVIKTYDTVLKEMIEVCVLVPVLTERQWFKVVSRFVAPGGVGLTGLGWLIKRWLTNRRSNDA